MPAQRIGPINGGMVDGRPLPTLRPQECSALKNVRVYRNELRTSKGYLSSTSSVIRTGVTAINGLAQAVRADLTEDLIASSDGGHWRLVSDAKTLISVPANTGLITAVSGTAISGDTTARFDAEVSVGDLFWVNADGIAYAQPVASIETVSAMTLSASYAGATTAGAYNIWSKQAVARTKMLFWNGRWFFVNGADKLREWDGTTFRESGVSGRWGALTGITVTTATGGSLTGTTAFDWRFAYEDNRGFYGGGDAYLHHLKSTIGAATAVTKVTFTNDPRYQPPWVTHWRIYRAEASSISGATVYSAYHYLGRQAVASPFVDDGTVTASETNLWSEYGFPPSPGYEDLAVIDNRLAAISGQKLHVSGLPPSDFHTDTAGKVEPEYWSVSHRIGDGEGGQGYGFLQVRGRTYIIGPRDMFVVLVNADDPAVWGLKRELPNVGCVNKFSIAYAGNVAYWLGHLRGRLTVIEFDGYQLNDIGAAVKGSLDGVDTALFAQVEGGIGHGFYWVTIPLTGGTYRTLEYNIEARTWSYRDWQVQAYAQAGGDVYAAFDDGLVNKLETGLSKAGVTAAYQIDTGPFGLPRKSTGTLRRVPVFESEYPKRYHSTQIEMKAHSGSPVVSASYNVDEGAFTALSGSPIAVSAVPIAYLPLPTAAYGRRAQLRLEAVGSDIDFGVLGIAIKGEIDERDVD